MGEQQQEPHVEAQPVRAVPKPDFRLTLAVGLDGRVTVALTDVGFTNLMEALAAGDLTPFDVARVVDQAVKDGGLQVVLKEHHAEYLLDDPRTENLERWQETLRSHHATIGELLENEEERP